MGSGETIIRIITKKAGCILSFVTLFAYCVVSAGQGRVDSLYMLLNSAKNDTVRILLRAEIGEEISVTRVGYWDSIRIDAEKWHMKGTTAQALNNIGYVYDDLGDISRAFDYYNEGLKIREQIGDRHGIAESLNNMAHVVENQGDIPRGLEYYFRGLKIQEEINDKKGKSTSLNNIAYIYEYQNDIPNALKYYNESLAIAGDLNDRDQMATDVHNIGLVYRKLALQIRSSDVHKSDSLLNISMGYLTRSLELFREAGNNEGIATIYQNIGLTYQDRNDHPGAKEYYNKSLTLWNKLGYKRGIALILAAIGDLYLNENNYPEALSCEKKALSLYKDLGYPQEISSTAGLLSEIYQAQNKWPDAFRMQNLFYVMRDSTNNQTTRKASMQKQFQYEYEKKEALLKAGQEKERAVALEKSRKQTIVIWAIISGLVIVAVFAGLIYRALRLTKRQKKLIELKNRETESQKKIIEEKNKDITDSIVYAKRIQQARLPDIKEINAFFPQSFVLFRPKAIVSGDFYFFHRTGNACFLAAADCTGHGVPGALMSMVGSEKLEEAISMSMDTAGILKHLNVGIRNALHQTDTGESTHDGMDIALCYIDPVNFSMKFAGANRPLWIIHKGNTEIEEIDGTRKAIGGYTDDSQEFHASEIKLHPGDTFYICTDGYADTFNGKTGKKLKTKKFMELLAGIQEMDLAEQEKWLSDFIEKWKGGSEQVDDILVIGVRV